MVTIVLFRLRPLNEALAWTIIAGYMLLPRITAFDLPLLPAWDKELVPSLFAAIMCFALVASDKTSRQGRATQRVDAGGPIADGFTIRRGKVLFWGLIVLLFGSPLITVMNNMEPLVEGDRFLAGLELYDGLSVNLNLLVGLAPFFLARRYLNSPESHVVLLKVLVIAALGYSLLALYEVRMSPQLNRIFYGFSPHRFLQNVRYGGFRPVLFLYHGIWVAILFSIAVIAAGALWREFKGTESARRWLLACFWLLMTLVLCKSMTALVIALLLLPLVLFTALQLQLLAAAAIASVVMLYPSLRGADLIPTQQIYSLVAGISRERADSLQYRFDAEDAMLLHANRKPLAGWGSGGRNRVQTENDRTIATDGYWIIVTGVYGWMGYIAQFGLLGLSTVLLAFNRRRFNLSPATAGLTLVLAGSLIDLLPNATISPVVWLVAGALMGRYQTARAIEKTRDIRAARVTASGRHEEQLRPPSAAAEEKPAYTRPPLHIRKPREG
ncbi:hypothetical protein [Lutimaribacter pacificus]|uniref:hypothetical protein n=1 Tax=Lutimaribacter pacificus TaxID=391948 RepID=UPI00122CAC5D|nr:hypothetical protein [Lutimaribacter pacificus]